MFFFVLNECFKFWKIKESLRILDAFRKWYFQKCKKILKIQMYSEKLTIPFSGKNIAFSIYWTSFFFIFK